MLAISTLSASVQTFFYGAAVVLLLVGGSGLAPTEKVRLDSLGLALFVFVFFWNALAAS